MLGAKKDFTLTSLIAAAYDSYLPAFEVLIPRLLKAYEAAPVSSLKTRLTDQIAAAFNAHFLNPSTGQYGNGSQLSQLWPLFLGIVPVSNDGPLYQRLLILWSALAAYALAARIYKARQEAVPANERGKVFDVSSAIGSIFLLTALWALLLLTPLQPSSCAARLELTWG